MDTLEVRFANEQEAREFVAAVQARDASSVRYLFRFYGGQALIVWGDVLQKLSAEDRKFADECIDELHGQIDEESCSG